MSAVPVPFILELFISLLLFFYIYFICCCYCHIDGIMVEIAKFSKMSLQMSRVVRVFIVVVVIVICCLRCCHQVIFLAAIHLFLGQQEEYQLGEVGSSSMCICSDCSSCVRFFLVFCNIYSNNSSCCNYKVCCVKSAIASFYFNYF